MLFRWFRQRLRRDASPTESSQSTSSVDVTVSSNVIAELREEISRISSDNEERRARDCAAISAAIAELQNVTLRVESHVTQQLDRLSQKVSSLRQEYGSLARTIEDVQKKARESIGRTDLLQNGMETLASSFDKQLTQSELSLKAVKESSERHIKEMKGNHARQMEWFDSLRVESEDRLRKSKDRFRGQLIEFAEFMQIDSGLPVRTRPVDLTSVKGIELPSWAHPFARFKAAAKQRSQGSALLGQLARRTRDLEEYLWAQKEENVSRAQKLLKAWDDELADAEVLVEIPDAVDENGDFTMHLGPHREGWRVRAENGRN